MNQPRSIIRFECESCKRKWVSDVPRSELSVIGHSDTKYVLKVCEECPKFNRKPA